MAERLAGRSLPVLQVWNKSDAVAEREVLAEDDILLSARQGEGLDALRRKLLELAGWQSAPEGLYLARERHLEALRQVESYLHDADRRLGLGNAALDLLAEELRLAQNALNAITGEFGADELLGVIFSRFCIGK
jgi:tRNA modification GTPase